MTTKATRLTFSIVMFVLCLLVMCFGVYAAASVNYQVTGSISYELKDVFVEIETRHYLSQAASLDMAQEEVSNMMKNIADTLESGTSTQIQGSSEMTSDYDYESTVNNYQEGTITFAGDVNIAYGTYLENKRAFSHYIAIVVKNYASEDITGTLDISPLYTLQGSNSLVGEYQLQNTIPALKNGVPGSACFVFALTLVDASQSVSINFQDVNLVISQIA